MSEASNFYLLLKQIGTYLEQAKTREAVPGKELKIALDAFSRVVDSFYPGEIECCAAGAALKHNHEPSKSKR